MSPCCPAFRRSAFTLVEVLIVLVIVAILAAILIPVFSGARAKGNDASCSSQLHQLGLAVRQYAADYDDRMPAAVDPSDKMLSINYAAYPKFQVLIPLLPNIQDVMAPYSRDPELWHCPRDTGYDVYDATQQPMNGRPTSYAAIGTSYFYRTQLTYDYMKPDELALGHLRDLRDPAQTDVFYDASGWHSPDLPICQRRYNVLCADGHVGNFDRNTLAWIQHQPL